MSTHPTPRGRQRRETLLRAATDLFIENGYANTSLDDIIEHAGGSRATIYSAFGGKEGLLQAVIGRFTDEFQEHLDAVDFDHKPLEEGLQLIGREFLQMILSPIALGMFRVTVSEAPRLPEVGRAYYQSGVARVQERLCRYLVARNTAGELCLENPQLATAQFLAMLKADLQIGALMGPCCEPTDEQIEASVAMAVGIFVHGCVGPVDINSTQRQ